MRRVAGAVVLMLAATGSAPAAQSPRRLSVAHRGPPPMPLNTPSPRTAWRSRRALTSSSRISPSRRTASSSASMTSRSSARPTSRRYFPIVRPRSSPTSGKTPPDVAGQRLHAGRDQDPRRRHRGSTRSSPASGSPTFDEAVARRPRQGRSLSRSSRLRRSTQGRRRRFRARWSSRRPGPAAACADPSADARTPR